MKRETERERVNIKIDNLFYVFVRGVRKREVVRVFFFGQSSRTRILEGV